MATTPSAGLLAPSIEEGLLAVQERGSRIRASHRQIRIHRTAGSTKYLIHRTWPSAGKKARNLLRGPVFFDLYEKILAETDIPIGRQYDEMLGRLSTDEAQRDGQLHENIARQTIIVDKNLDDLREGIIGAGNFFGHAAPQNYFQFIHLQKFSPKT